MKKRKIPLATAAKKLAGKHAEDFIPVFLRKDFDLHAFDYLYTYELARIINKRLGTNL